MQKLKHILFKQPLLTAATVCFAIAASIFIFFSTEEVAVKNATVKPETTPTHSASSGQAITLTPTEVEEVFGAQTQLRPTSQDFDGQATGQQITTIQQVYPTATNTPAPTHAASSASNAAKAGQASAPEKKTFTVSLSINGSGVGSVTLEEGATQCDVLSKALDQGRISQLLMKYVSSLGTNGVYQINGVGKDNAVWWVYTVNGTSATQGCSLVKAASGDTILWEYIGS